MPADPHFSIAYRLADRRWELLRGRASAAAGLEVVCGGVIVNAPRLRRLLGLSLNAGTADLLAHAYRRWGTDLGLHVEGQFAGAVFAANCGMLALVQDYLGLFPLSLRRDGDILRVATDLADIARADDELDATYAAIYLANGIAEGPYTPFKKIRRLEPGQAAYCTKGSLAIRGLAPLVDVMPERKPDVPAKAEELRRLIEEAVRAFTVGAVRLGCEVSGGLDSASVATSAVKVADGRPIAFSRSLAAHDRNDFDWAVKIASALRLDHNVVDGERHPPFSRTLDRAPTEPGDWAMNAAMTMAYRDALAANGIDVLLTGQGGDAVLLGDVPGQYHLADELVSGRFISLMRAIRNIQAIPENHRPARYWLKYYGILPIVRRWRGQRVEGYLHETPLPEWLSENLIDRSGVRVLRRRAPVVGLPGIAQTAMAERITAVVAAVTRHSFYPHYGISVHHPLLHLPVIRFMLSMPNQVVTGDWHDRHLHRLAMRAVAPADVMNRRDKGGGGGRYLRALGAQPELVRSLADDSALAAEGFVDQAKWSAQLVAASAGRADNVGQFASAVCYELWLRQWRTNARETATSTLSS